VAVATDRYKKGKAKYYEILEAQQQLFPAENTLTRIEAGHLLAGVQPYKALVVAQGFRVVRNLYTIVIRQARGWRKATTNRT
jgi:hypothetical protein